MKEKILQPHPSLKTIWYIGYFIFLFIFYFLPIVPLVYFNQLLSFGIYSFVILPCFIIALWWIPVFFKTITYTLKEDHIEINKGVFWQQNKTIPFSKITDVKAVQGPLQRYFSIGSLFLQTAGTGAQNIAEGRLMGLTEYKKKQQDLLAYIRKQYATSRENKGEKQKTIESKSETVFTDILITLQNIEKELKGK
jgi:membrane protein YdbS with pleckstrin-like domain